MLFIFLFNKCFYNQWAISVSAETALTSGIYYSLCESVHNLNFSILPEDVSAGGLEETGSIIYSTCWVQLLSPTNLPQWLKKAIAVIYCNVTDETITNMKHGHTCGLSWSSWSSRKWLHSTLAKSSSKPTSMALSALTSSLSLYSLKCIKQNRDKVMRRAGPQTTGVAAAVRVESANRKVDPCLPIILGQDTAGWALMRPSQCKS